MYKAILLVILLSIPFVSGASVHSCPTLTAEGFTERQVRVMYRAFQIGKQKDMSYSLAAIAWKESSAGKYMINLQDPSFSVFHITIDNALVYLKWEDTNFNRNRAAQLLIEDFQLAAEFAMINLQFWKDNYGSNWHKIWASYNSGYNWSNGVEYSNDVASKIQKIKLCNWS
jgi:hypothetical protein